MSPKQTTNRATAQERTFSRFALGQRWEHAILILSSFVLLITGLPQKYRDFSWSQDLLSTPERLNLIQQIHHIAAVILALEALYHLGRGIYLLASRKMSADMFPNMQDVYDAWHMVQYLLFMRKDKPAFGKYNFEQKVTYWFLFFGFAMMGISGFIIWFPVQFTWFLPGGVVPASKMAHSTEAVVAAIFIVVWHLYHVHIERLNLSIFTGRLSEGEMKEFHAKEYEKMTSAKPASRSAGEHR
jgi:formate dehydrogenase gamma subunit